jgi:glycosyltransferase involved in cell wall biosynthesis
MRLLMSADAVGGVFTYALELIAGLRSHGDEVVLATSGAVASTDQRRRIDRAGVAEWHERDLALEWMDDPWQAQRATARWLLALADRVRPDLVHLNSYGIAAADWRAPVVVVAHSDVWSWWRAVHATDPPPGWEPYRRHVVAGLERATAVVAPTRAALDQLDDAFGPLPARQCVIANGIVAAPGDDRPAKEQFALAAGRLWDEAKNLRALVAAAERLPAGAVRHAGDTGGADTGRCRPLGVLDAPALAVQRRRAAVFAAPARYEPFGLAILEAALAGCSLVLGDIPSLRETWGADARYVDPADDVALAAAVRAALADPRPALDRARRLTPERMADAYLAAYARLPVAA